MRELKKYEAGRLDFDGRRRFSNKIRPLYDRLLHMSWDSNRCLLRWDVAKRFWMAPAQGRRSSERLCFTHRFVRQRFQAALTFQRSMVAAANLLFSNANNTIRTVVRCLRTLLCLCVRVCVCVCVCVCVYVCVCVCVCVSVCAWATRVTCALRNIG